MLAARGAQNIQAQLRACVYGAIIAKEKAPSAPSLAMTPDSRLALALIDDFLRFHKLQSTASTAAAEVIGWGERTEPSAAAAELHLPSPVAQSELPLLVQLIGAHRGGRKLPTSEARSRLPPQAARSRARR